MTIDKLQLNESKTEFVLSDLRKIENPVVQSKSNKTVPSQKGKKNLIIIFDHTLSINDQVSALRVKTEPWGMPKAIKTKS